MGRELTLTPVDSGWIKAIGYDPKSKTLHVATKAGGTYQYLKVPPATHQALMAADSIGEHLNAHIKPKHQFRKVK